MKPKNRFPLGGTDDERKLWNGTLAKIELAVVYPQSFTDSDGVFSREQADIARTNSETRAGRRLQRSIDHHAKMRKLAEARETRNENARWKRA